MIVLEVSDGSSLPGCVVGVCLCNNCLHHIQRSLFCVIDAHTTHQLTYLILTHFVLVIFSATVYRRNWLVTGYILHHAVTGTSHVLIDTSGLSHAVAVDHCCVITALSLTFVNW